MTEAPEVYPDFPDEEESSESDEQGVEGAAEHTEPGAHPRTGDPRVDAVLDSLEALDDRPVSEHAAIFEGAHEALRSALEPQRDSA
jgi:hypothetical protein